MFWSDLFKKFLQVLKKLQIILNYMLVKIYKYNAPAVEYGASGSNAGVVGLTPTWGIFLVTRNMLIQI
jgi:hypothetical protein